MRKLCLVGLPVFFVAEGLWQLIFGLVVCFASLGVFCVCLPYRDVEDTVLQVACQLCLFFTLVSKIVLGDAGVTDVQVSLTQALLITALAVPPASLNPALPTRQEHCLDPSGSTERAPCSASGAARNLPLRALQRHHPRAALPQRRRAPPPRALRGAAN